MRNRLANLVIPAILFPAAIALSATTRFSCTFVESVSADGREPARLSREFLLDTGRKKAYAVRDNRKIGVEYHVSAKDTMVAFVEVEPDQSVALTTVDAGQASTLAHKGVLYLGRCRVY